MPSKVKRYPLSLERCHSPKAERANLSAVPETLVPNGGMFLPRDTTNIPLNWKLRLSPVNWASGLHKPTDLERNNSVRRGD